MLYFVYDVRALTSDPIEQKIASYRLQLGVHSLTDIKVNAKDGYGKECCWTKYLPM